MTGEIANLLRPSCGAREPPLSQMPMCLTPSANVKFAKAHRSLDEKIAAGRYGSGCAAQSSRLSARNRSSASMILDLRLALIPPSA
jgi:hypothetical protein